MSIEQTSEFIILRRILRVVSPEFTILTRSDMAPGTSLLDPDRKMITVSEHTDLQQAIATSLFQIGKIRFAICVPGDTPGTEGFYRNYAQAMNRHDRQASQWALSQYVAFWPNTNPEEVRDLIREHVISTFEWLQYLRS